MKETLALFSSKEKRQPNRRDGRTTKQQGQANQRPKHSANKAKALRAEKKGSRAVNTSELSSDDAETEEEATNQDEMIYRADRATVLYLDRRDELPSHERKPFGLSHRPIKCHGLRKDAPTDGRAA